MGRVSLGWVIGWLFRGLRDEGKVEGVKIRLIAASKCRRPKPRDYEVVAAVTAKGTKTEGERE